MKIENILVHVTIVFVFLVAALLYFKPIAFDGKVLRQHDNTQARGMQTEIMKYQKLEGKVPKWTNQVFVGMPSYQIYGPYRQNYIHTTLVVLRFWQSIGLPHPILFLIMLFSYIGLLAMRLDKWIALLGALSFGFMTNNIVLFEAGHSTKLHAMVFLGAIIGGFIMVLRGKKTILGLGIFTFAIAANITANHYQVTYYLMFILGFIGLAFAIDAISKKNILSFIKRASMLALGVLLGVLCNLSPLLTTYEYSGETIRGKSELTSYNLTEDNVNTLISKGVSVEDANKLRKTGVVGKAIKVKEFYLQQLESILGAETFAKYKNDLISLGKMKPTKGLDKDYIFAWSYGKMESFTFLLPNFYGGSNGQYFGTQEHTNSSKEIGKMMANVTNPQQRGQVMQQLIGLTSQYWGDQPFTSGPVYFGIIICFLAFLGMFMFKGPAKWGLVIAAVILVFIGWGKNFAGFNYFMVDNFPMFNKFRAITIALSVVQITMVLLAMMGLSAFINFEKKQKLTTRHKGLIMPALFKSLGLEESRVLYLYCALGATILLCTIGYFYSFGDLASVNDARRFDPLLKQAPQQWGGLIEAIKLDRAALIRQDVLRALIYLGLAGAVMWAYATNKFKQAWLLILGVGVMSMIDLIQIDLLYINKDTFKSKNIVQEGVVATPADKQILNDKDPHFRVFDLITGMRSGSSSPSNPFSNAEGAFLHKTLGGYHAAKPILLQELVEAYFVGNSILTDKRHILEMLNTKYIINSADKAVQMSSAMGNAWFVDKVDLVENADMELVKVGDLTDVRSRAITQKKNAAYLEGLNHKASSGDYIKLTNYHPEELVFESNAANERFAVFSEIYYPPKKGWSVYIDGKKIDEGFIKVNYLLRGLRVPAGKHKIQMVFEPQSFRIGETSAFFASLIVLGFLGFSIYWTIRHARTNKEEDEELQ